MSILLAALTTLLGQAPDAADDHRPLVPSVTVVGSDEVAAKPDMAEITTGVVTQAPAAQDALQNNSEAMQRLLQALTARGIAERDIQTAGFNVSPQYHHDPKGEHPPKIVGYQVSNQVRVKVRRLGQLGPILDEVVSKGANQVHGVAFSVAEPAPLLDEARQKAIEDGRRKAELYCKAAGVTLGRVLLIQEQTPHIIRPGPVFAARSADGAVPVAAGELEFHANITVTFALK
jgi:uncharacterized protein YggE